MTTTEQTIYAATIQDITASIGQGKSLRDACAEVLSRIRADGQIDALLDELGTEWLAYVWRRRQHRQRENAGRSAMGEGQHSNRVNALRSPDATLECLYEVEGRWVRLGEITGKECGLLAKRHRGLMEANGHKAVFFEGLEMGLRPEQMVAEKYGEDKVQEMFQVAMATGIGYEGE